MLFSALQDVLIWLEVNNNVGWTPPELNKVGINSSRTLIPIYIWSDIPDIDYAWFRTWTTLSTSDLKLFDAREVGYLQIRALTCVFFFSSIESYDNVLEI